MPRISVYPDWVKELCPPGHSVKRNGNNYYLYETRSVYVPGKKNPQPQSRYVGVITPEGIRYSSRRVVNTEEHPEWYEYGFTYCLYEHCYKALLKDFKSDKMANAVMLNVIRQLSPRSYVLKDKEIESPENLHICICNQIKKLESTLKIRFGDYEILKDIHILELNGKKIITAVSDGQKKLIDQLGADIYA